MTDNGEAYGGGAGRPRPAQADDAIALHEEELEVGTRWEGVGNARVRREVDRERVGEVYPRRREDVVEERVPAGPDDSGKIETLPDGSISIPLFEEELVVTRRTVLRERVIVRKVEVTETERVEAELRRERVSFETDDAPPGSVEQAD
jgi:uncharacterized protein (TIGR02271 family)